MTREKVDRAWLDVARDAGRQEREGEVYLLRAEIERLRAALLEIEREATAVKPPRYSWFGERARRALEPKP